MTTDYAEFTTKGGLLYATATGFLHGGFAQPDVGVTRIHVGADGSPKDFQAGTRPSNTLVTVRVVEDDFNKFELPAGTYWLISSNYAEISIVSCEEMGVSNPKSADPSHSFATPILQ
ncbi:MAG: hypothetical protein WD627_11705 [Actinomycetota bacterium]